MVGLKTAGVERGCATMPGCRQGSTTSHHRGRRRRTIDWYQRVLGRAAAPGPLADGTLPVALLQVGRRAERPSARAGRPTPDVHAGVRRPVLPLRRPGRRILAARRRRGRGGDGPGRAGVDGEPAAVYFRIPTATCSSCSRSTRSDGSGLHESDEHDAARRGASAELTPWSPAGDRELWQARRAGFLSVHLPEEYGGGGGGLSELVVVSEAAAAQGCPLLLLLVSAGHLRRAARPVRYRRRSAPAGSPVSARARRWCSRSPNPTRAPTATNLTTTATARR